MGSYWSQFQAAEKENKQLKEELHTKNLREEEKKKIDEYNRSKEKEEKTRLQQEMLST